MPKYYCATGKFKTIVVADNMDSAIHVATQRLIDTEQDSGLIMSISETGYDLRKCLVVSMIPLLKKFGVPLPPLCLIIERACKLLGKDPKALSKDMVNWMIDGS